MDERPNDSDVGLVGAALFDIPKSVVSGETNREVADSDNCECERVREFCCDSDNCVEQEQPHEQTIDNPIAYYQNP